MHVCRPALYNSLWTTSSTLPSTSGRLERQGWQVSASTGLNWFKPTWSWLWSWSWSCRGLGRALGHDLGLGLVFGLVLVLIMIFLMSETFRTYKYFDNFSVQGSCGTFLYLHRVAFNKIHWLHNKFILVQKISLRSVKDPYLAVFISKKVVCIQ